MLSSNKSKSVANCLMAINAKLLVIKPSRAELYFYFIFEDKKPRIISEKSMKSYW